MRVYWIHPKNKYEVKRLASEYYFFTLVRRKGNEIDWSMLVGVRNKRVTDSTQLGWKGKLKLPFFAFTLLSVNDGSSHMAVNFLENSTFWKCIFHV